MTIEIIPSLLVDESEIAFDFIRSSGPGGQNVNKVATGVQLRFNVNDSPSLPEDVKARLFLISHNRINAGGELIIEAKSERTQEQNRAEALQRFVDLLRQAAHPPKPRRATRPTAASRVRRLEQKRRRSQVKQERRSGRDLPQE